MRDMRAIKAFEKDAGREEGYAKGLEEGLAEGEAKGEANTLREVVLNLHASGMPAEEIATRLKRDLAEIKMIIKSKSADD